MVLRGALRWALWGSLSLAAVFLGAWLLSALGPRAPSPRALSYFDTGHLRRVQEKAKKQYLAWAAGSFLEFSAAVGVVMSGWLARTALRATATTGRSSSAAFASGVLAGILWVIITSLARLPVDYYAGYLLEVEYGLSRTTGLRWLADHGKSIFLSAALIGASCGALGYVMYRFPDRWPYLAGMGALLISLAVTYLYPVLVAPMFYRFRPLEEQGLLADVRELAESAGIQVSRVLVMEASAKTGRLNAYFAGLGRTREVVLYDTLLGHSSRKQVRVILAHEMSHAKRGHVLWGALLTSAGALVFFLLFDRLLRSSVPAAPGGRSPAVVYIIALLLLFLRLAEFVTAPAANWISRQFEVRADLDSLSWTRDPEAFVECHVSLARANLSDVEPPAFIRWFAWTHPTTIERLSLASSQ